jgi:hypothetical protein
MNIFYIKIEKLVKEVLLVTIPAQIETSFHQLERIFNTLKLELSFFYKLFSLFYNRVNTFLLGTFLVCCLLSKKLSSNKSFIDFHQLIGILAILNEF